MFDEENLPRFIGLKDTALNCLKSIEKELFY